VSDRPPAGAERVRVRAVVSGRVQGVWFRESCRREADRLGVSGWVRNTPDGSVEIEAEGERAAVEALVGWARRGPQRARVASVRLADLAPRGDSGFVVTR
jgi:acylphosphatase